MRRIIVLYILVFLLSGAHAQVSDGRVVENFFKAPGTPANPKVQVTWNRYYSNEGLYNIYRQLVAAFPDLVRLESIGKSHEGRELWLLTITNFKLKPHDQKPAFWIDGGIHANEIQGSEIALYTAWYLLENYNQNVFITNLVNEKTFYILPVSSPDGREYFMNQPGTVNSSRSGTIALDDDGDGLSGEDGFDDLNGDGHITMMRRRNPYGGWKSDPDDPNRMIRARADEFGQWEMLGY
jgi:hypothetical protein